MLRLTPALPFSWLEWLNSPGTCYRDTCLCVHTFAVTCLLRARIPEPCIQTDWLTEMHLYTFAHPSKYYCYIPFSTTCSCQFFFLGYKVAKYILSWHPHRWSKWEAITSTCIVIFSTVVKATSSVYINMEGHSLDMCTNCMNECNKIPLYTMQ